MILSNDLDYEGRSGSKNLKNLTRKYTARHTVLTDDEADDQSVILAAFTLGDPYSPDPGAVLTEVSARQDPQSTTTWRVDLTYDSQAEDITEQFEDPLDRSTTWQYRMENVQSPIQDDLDGTTVANSAGDPYLPPVTLEQPLLKITAIKNWPTLDMPYILGQVDQINDAPWLGFPKYGVKLDTIQPSDSQYDNGTTYYAYTYNFTVKTKWINQTGDPANPIWELVGDWATDDGRTELLDQGFYKLGLSANGRVPILDSQGHQKSTPSLLDNGDVSTTGPHYVKFLFYIASDFTTLGL